MKRWVLIGAAGLVLIIFLFWWQNPTQVLKRRTASLVDLVDMGEVKGVGIMDMNALGRLLAEEVHMDLEALELESMHVSSSDVELGYRWIGENAKYSGFSIEEIESIVIKGDAARVIVELDARFELPEIRMLEGTHRVEFCWRKDEDGSWRLEELIWR